MMKLMRRLNNDLKKQIECTVQIEFGQDVGSHNIVTMAKLICDTWNVKSKLVHRHKYCCRDYLVLVVDDSLNLYDAECFVNALNFHVDIYYTKGAFKALYDNTYC